MIGKESTEGNISGDQAVMTAKPTETTVVDPSKMRGGPGDVWRRGNEEGLTLKQANEQTRNWMLASGWDVSKIPAHERDDVFADVRMNRLNNPKVNGKEFLHVGGGVVLEKQEKPIVYKPKKKKKKKS